MEGRPYSSRGSSSTGFKRVGRPDGPFPPLLCIGATGICFLKFICSGFPDCRRFEVRMTFVYPGWFLDWWDVVGVLESMQDPGYPRIQVWVGFQSPQRFRGPMHICTPRIGPATNKTRVSMCSLGRHYVERALRYGRQNLARILSFSFGQESFLSAGRCCTIDYGKSSRGLRILLLPTHNMAQNYTTYTPYESVL